MTPAVHVIDNALGRAKRLWKSLFEIVEVELRHERFGRDAVEARNVPDERAKGQERSRHQLRHGFCVTGGFDVPLAQVQDVTTGLHLARAAQLLFRYENLRKEIRSLDHATGCDNFRELERKRIKRAAELRFDDEQRCFNACFIP